MTFLLLGICCVAMGTVVVNQKNADDTKPTRGARMFQGVSGKSYDSKGYSYHPLKL
jgi:hypothetical protein